MALTRWFAGFGHGPSALLACRRPVPHNCAAQLYRRVISDLPTVEPLAHVDNVC
jgi:hypothetical protein